MASSVDVTIDEILLLLPPEQTALITAITTLKSELWNQSPEALKMDYCWGRLYNVLVKNTPSSDEQWVKDLVQLYNERYSGKI
jgi:hypothetical protein